ncbi:MAG TPA: MBL fold metallo-hydrolase [Candidatus Methylomirabilis sp.]|nr:MBL fold metallo-hydrolase [Candidatus Methylomirabilis sp.]
MRKTLLLFSLLLFACAALNAQQAAAPSSLPFTLKPLGNNVYAAIAAQRAAGANAGFIIGDDGVAVVDSFVTAGAAKQLLAEIQKLTKLPIKYVINTHYHLDHTAGNGVFAEAGASVVGHKNIRGWIHTENLKFFGANIKPEQRAMVEGLVAPNIVYDSEIELFLGSKRVVVRYYPGHTGGDSVVFVPDANVVFCGDLFWRKTLPNMIDGTTDKWAETDAKLVAEAPTAKFVPGHGDVGDANDVKDFGGYILDLRDYIAKAEKDGLSGDALTNAVLPQVKEKYGSWDAFDHFSKLNIADTEKELRGEKRIPKPSTQS